ncbi:MAG: LysE family transporter [Candidatus Bathyarchaeia archaeon]
MEFLIDFIFFLLSVVLTSLSGVMMPGPVFAVTVTHGYKSKVAGAIVALGHGAIEFPLMFLIFFGFEKFFTESPIRSVMGFVED